MLFLGLFGLEMQSQVIRQYSLEVSCTSRTINSSQSVLEFKWPYRTPTVQELRVFKKSKDVFSWGSTYRILADTDSTFNDTVTTGSMFEYKFEKDFGPDGNTIYGFALAGNRVPVETFRGKILILADSTHRTFLENDIRTFRNDLIGDGWLTELAWFDSFTTVNQLKTYIVSRYNANPSLLKSVVILGNLAVPYTGDYSGSGFYFPPDGHTGAAPPSHEGAWATDYYYACMDNPFWQDSLVTNTASARTANDNVPNDGKFDFTHLYFDISALNGLQVGRIDLSNMPAFSLNERSLLRQYLQKNHAFRHKEVTIRERCLIDDNFGVLTGGSTHEHFGSNAYRNLAPLLVSSSYNTTGDYTNTLDTADYLWSFGFGNGSYINCSNVGSTSGFASSGQELKSVFTGFFGSYFGDWDNHNNFLRAPLAAAGNVLNTFYCGRPHYYFHHMGMGESIGYSVLRTQNNIDTTAIDLLYPVATFSVLETHVNLMGDPSIRMQPVAPVSQFVARQDSCNNRFVLDWTASVDTAVHTYYVSRASQIDSSFTVIGITDNTTFTDSFPLSGDNVYMVRGSKLQISASGSYFNLSQGLFDTAKAITLVSNIDTSICLNQTVTLGSSNTNLSNVIYSWSPASGTNDTIQLTVTGSGNWILFATDTSGNCVLSDTFTVSALSLPLGETISSVNNSCSDTVLWGSTLNNGIGFEYNWVFNGANISDSSGMGLDSPGTVLYDIIGSYLSTLTVRNISTNCINTDSQFVTVTCVSLPIELANINCVNTIKGKEVRFIVYDNERFNSYSIEGFNGVVWQEIKTIKSTQERYYKYVLDAFQQYDEIRIMAANESGERTELGTCNWTNNHSEWSVFPNPFTNEFTLTYNGINGNQVSNIQIFNGMGLEVYNNAFVFNDNQLIVSMKNLASGIYTIRIQTGDRIFVYKIIHS